MISDAQFLEQDAKILDIFREEGLEKSLDPSQDAKASVNDLDVEDLRRIERIVERAKFAMVMEHSLSFFFKTIGAGVSGLATAAIGAAKSASPNNKINKSGKDNDTDFNFNTLRNDIRSNSDIKNFENIVALNGGENSSIAAAKMENIVETLAYYTLNDMFVNGSSQTTARKKAEALISNSFQIEDTYYVPLIIDGKRLNQNQARSIAILNIH